MAANSSACAPSFSQSTRRRERPVSLRSTSSGLISRMSSSGGSAKSSAMRTPHATPCTHASGDSRGSTSSGSRALAAPASVVVMVFATGTPRSDPARPRPNTSATYAPMTFRLRPPSDFRIATVRMRCCTNTRVTLAIPIPPRTRMERPMRLRKPSTFESPADSQFSM